MFDANGRLPMEGFLTDTISIPVDICQLLENPDCAYSLPNSLRFINIKLPMGYAQNPGSYRECLGTENYETRYCNLYYLSGLDLPLPSQGLPEGRNAKNYLDAAKEKILKYRTLKMLSNENNNITLSALDSKSIRNYLDLLADAKISVDQEQVFQQMSFFLISLYSAVNAPPTVGICIPKQCTANDVNLNYYELTKLSFEGINVVINSHNYTLPIIGNLTIGTQDAQCYTDDNRTGTPEKMPGGNIFWYIVLSIIGLLVLIGTTMDMYNVFLASSKKDPKSQGLGYKLLLSFSAYTNGIALMKTDGTGSGHLDCLNGIRFLSMTWVVVGHSFISAFTMVIRNQLTMFSKLTGDQGLAFEAILNALPSVDTFFLMSGALTAYIFFKDLERAGNNGKKHTITFILYYIHRYLRISMLYAIVIGLTIAVFPYMSSGPHWFNVLTESADCRKNWWLNLLYVQTLVKMDQPSTCVGVSWYLVDDMMFHWWSPLVYYPMFYAFYKTKKHLIPFLWWLLVFLLFTFTVFYVTFTTKSAPMPLNAIEGYDPEYTYHVSAYFAPWLRYQAYLIGLILGYVLHHTRGKEIQIGGNTNILIWQVAFLSGFAVVYGLYDHRVSNTINIFDAMMYNTFQRIAWNGSVAWVIFSCVKGYGGIVNEFLTWSAFAPLSRLTFSAYLIHMQILTMFASSVMSEFPSDFSWWTSVIYYLPSLMITLVAAFFVALLFETPSIKVEKLLVEAVLKMMMPPTPVIPTSKAGPGNGIENVKNGLTEKPTENSLEVKPGEVALEIIADPEKSKEEEAATDIEVKAEVSRNSSSSNPPSYDEIESK